MESNPDNQGQIMCVY